MGFHGPYRFLSNFWSVDVVSDGFTYPTVEHAYQAAKTLDGLERARIRQAATPGEAKELGRQVALRGDWEQIRDDVMLGLLRHKFRDQDLLPQLLGTLGRDLVEVNDWGDTYWGAVRRADGAIVGQNRLGVLLRQVRAELLREVVARL